VDDGAGNCEACGVGSWSDGGLRLGNGCYDCPRSKSGLRTTTADQGAVTAGACKIEVCRPGWAVNKYGQCKRCPDGYTSPGGSVAAGADQPLCREEEVAADEEEEEEEAVELMKKVRGATAKDGGPGKKYAHADDEEDV